MEPQSEDSYHDASPIWSGFIYQGEVALYIALFCINNTNILKELTQEEIDNAEIEIEWLEDFSIKSGDKYWSSHQVKAIKKSNVSDYKKPLWKLIDKLNNKIVDRVYLHTTENIKNSSFKLTDIKLDDNFKEEKIVNIQKKIFALDETTRFDLQNKVCINKSDKDWALVVPIENIEKSIIEQIEVYYKTNFSNKNISYRNAYRHLCIELMNEHIKSRQTKKKGDLPKKNITFREIRNLLNNVPQEATITQFAYCLRKKIWYVFQKMKHKNTINIKEEKRLIGKYLEVIHKYEDTELFHFIAGLVFHKNINIITPDLEEFANMIQEEHSNGYEKPLYWCLSKSLQLAIIDNERNNGSIYWNINLDSIPQKLVATIIHADDDAEEYAKDILCNSYEKLYGVKFILTKNFDDNLYKLLDDTTKSNFELDIECESEKFHNRKNVEFISQNKALELINNKT